jgi:general secretion pathway protein L
MSAAELLSQPLSRLRARYAQSPLPRFFDWWGGELRACLPDRWRRLLAVEESQVLIEVEGDELVVSRSLREGNSVLLARLPTTDKDALPAALDAALGEEQRELRRVLLLPPTTVLRRTLSLPTAALDNLRTVLGFELDRQTPFKPEQVVFDSRVLRQEPGAKQVSVELALVTRERLNQTMSELGAVAATLAAVDARDASGQRLGYNFLPADQRRNRNNTRLWIHLGLAAATVLLLLLAMGRLLDNRAGAVDALRAEVDRQQQEARAVAKLRLSLEEAATAANFLAIEKARQPSMLMILFELTRLLPDETYLERLSINRGELSLNGQSDQAAKLLELLQGTELLRSPALSGPIQPDARTGKDRFNITAGYGPEPEPEADDAPVARR